MLAFHNLQDFVNVFLTVVKTGFLEQSHDQQLSDCLTGDMLVLILDRLSDFDDCHVVFLGWGESVFYRPDDASVNTTI